MLKSYLKKIINFLYVVYIDHQTQQMHIGTIEGMFDNLSNSGLRDIIIVGDFNNDMLNPTASTELINLTSSYNFHQLVDEPTHYTENSSSVIDLVLVCKPEKLTLLWRRISFYTKPCSVHLSNCSVFKVSKACWQDL